MPIGIVSDAEFEAELKNSSVDLPHQKVPETTVITGEVIDAPTKGRGNNPQVPDSLRKIIGETSQLEGRKSALEFAKSLGISPSSVSAYNAGATSTASIDTPSPTISKHISERKSAVANTAMSRLKRSLNVLTEEKIKTGSAREVAAIAKDMAAIVKIMEPENPNGNEDKPSTQFVVYAPQFKNENHFETIVAKDDF